MNCEVKGLPELNRKLSVMKTNFDGRPLQAVCMGGAKIIRDQAKRNARRGPTGNVIKQVRAFAGKKASKYGQLAVAMAGWKGSGAIFEEWGTKDHDGAGKAMRIPLSKIGASGKGKRSKVTGAFGYVFAKMVRGMKGTRFFENAVESKMPQAQQVVEEGCKRLIEESIR